jgi:hypothetical protein
VDDSQISPRRRFPGGTGAIMSPLTQNARPGLVCHTTSIESITIKSRSRPGSVGQPWDHDEPRWNIPLQQISEKKR